MKKLAISVIFGSLLFSSDVISSEHYRPREFWEGAEMAKPALEQAYGEAQVRVKGRRYHRANDRLDLLACGIATNIYPIVAKYVEQKCLEPLSIDEFLTSLGLHAPIKGRNPIKSILDFLDYVGDILDRKLH